MQDRSETHRDESHETSSMYKGLINLVNYMSIQPASRILGS